MVVTAGAYFTLLRSCESIYWREGDHERWKRRNASTVLMSTTIHQGSAHIHFPSQQYICQDLDVFIVGFGPGKPRQFSPIHVCNSTTLRLGTAL